MVRVAGTADADWFLRSGRAAYDAIADHVPLDEAADRARLRLRLRPGARATGASHSGCSRRQRSRRQAPSTGAGATSSSRASSATRSHRRSPFADASFDLVYALSVFTHLTADLQTSVARRARGACSAPAAGCS